MWRLGAGDRRDVYGHTEQVRAISFTPDSRLMATGSWDRTVRIWPVPTADRLLVTRHAPFDRGLPVAPDAVAGWLAGATRARVDETGVLANPR